MPRTTIPGLGEVQVLRHEVLGRLEEGGVDLQTVGGPQQRDVLLRDRLLQVPAGGRLHGFDGSVVRPRLNLHPAHRVAAKAGERREHVSGILHRPPPGRDAGHERCEAIRRTLGCYRRARARGGPRVPPGRKLASDPSVERAGLPRSPERLRQQPLCGTSRGADQTAGSARVHLKDSTRCPPKQPRLRPGFRTAVAVRPCSPPGHARATPRAPRGSGPSHSPGPPGVRPLALPLALPRTRDVLAVSPPAIRGVDRLAPSPFRLARTPAADRRPQDHSAALSGSRPAPSAPARTPRRGSPSAGPVRVVERLAPGTSRPPGTSRRGSPPREGLYAAAVRLRAPLPRHAQTQPTSRPSCSSASGPIVIGQGCEFDYSGTQACKALREEGFKVVLVNSNPATIMTDPQFADRTYIEPHHPGSRHQDHREASGHGPPHRRGAADARRADGPQLRVRALRRRHAHTAGRGDDRGRP